MSPERKGLRQIVETLRQEVNYVLQGRSPEEDRRIRRIAENPSSISPRDIDLFRESVLLEIMFRGRCDDTNPIGAKTVYRNLDKLSPEELKQLTIEDAIRKAGLWKLLPQKGKDTV